MRFAAPHPLLFLRCGLQYGLLMGNVNTSADSFNQRAVVVVRILIVLVVMPKVGESFCEWNE